MPFDTSMRENVTLYVLPFASLPSAGLDGDIFFTSDTSELYMGQGGGLPLVLIGPGSSGSNALADLTDINLGTLADGDVLTYDIASGKWVNVAAAVISKHGNGSAFQMSDGTGVSAHYASFDANGNVTDSGVPSNPATGAIAISWVDSSGATVSLSTEGTEFWFADNALAGVVPRLYSYISTNPSVLHFKAYGPTLPMMSFNWIVVAGSASTAGTQGINTTLTADDSDNANRSSNSAGITTCGGLGAAAQNSGFGFEVPSDGYSRRVRLYMRFSTLVASNITGELKVKLSDGSLADATSGLTINASAKTGYFEVTFNSLRDGQRAYITFRRTDATVGAVVIAFAGMSMAIL